ncbi:DNA replication/repair protein RecF [Mesorhizobium xinjiangense]|uniref:DNA replication/repair protein RecF n=1 Tax=Mesorhizobium xinjiangense TaxID=2678685 RepID=UPI0012ED8F59|nr:DNA replication/repair protein RecF [Mesorhizobium xinjiangense]
MSPPQVSISKLTLTGFRNYAHLSSELLPGLVVLTGENGAGKTNLLEAISFLTPGRGLRRAAYGEVAKEGTAGGFAVHARIETPDGEHEIGSGAGGSPGGEADSGRKVRIDGTSARSAEELLDYLRVMWLTPAMDGLFTGPAADRRRFLDRLVLTIDPAHGRRSLDFERTMRSRNRMLTDNVRDDNWFAAIETQMAETGAAVAAARREMVRLLGAKIELIADDAPFPKADIAMSGFLEDMICQQPAVEVEEFYRSHLARNRERDRAAGRALDGPHRSDLVVRHRPKAMAAEFCSTGEQKALLVGLVISHARLTGELAGMAPVLLLDEIAAHFDRSRREALFGILEELNAQVFMTGTEAALFEDLRGRAQFFTVANGTVTPDDAD